MERKYETLCGGWRGGAWGGGGGGVIGVTWARIHLQGHCNDCWYFYNVNHDPAEGCRVGGMMFGFLIINANNPAARTRSLHQGASHWTSCWLKEIQGRVRMSRKQRESLGEKGAVRWEARGRGEVVVSSRGEADCCMYGVTQTRVILHHYPLHISLFITAASQHGLEK